MTESITAYKAFNADWTCRDFRFQVGQTYQHDGDIEMCSAGFHACEVPFDCWTYYEGSMTFAKVELSGVSHERADDSKRVAASITISASLSLPEWIQEQVRVVVDLCRAATGRLASDEDECAAATGVSGHAAATGYSGHAAVQGKNAIAASLGMYGTARAEAGGAIVLAAYDREYNLVAVRSALVGQDGVEAGKTYRLTVEGEFEVVE